MKEDLLHYIWRTQQFNKEDLKTVSGKHLHVEQVGHPHQDAGPDFLEGNVTIEDIAWRGDIEIHLRSSDWYAHKHEEDPRYNTVILHVVWEDNKKTVRADGTYVPTLALKGRVSQIMLKRYARLMQHPPASIPCSNHLTQVPRPTYHKMLKQALLARFSHKAHHISQLLQHHRYDAEVTAYQLLGANFGFKTNREAFLTLVEKVPLPLLHQHRPNLLSLEALCLGQAGFLSNLNEPMPQGYVQELKTHYHYLSLKHRLPPKMEPHVWKFSKLRPANFPTIRIVQFAQLIHLYPHLFPLLVNSTPAQLKSRLAVRPSTYWQHHYLIGKPSHHRIGRLGVKSIENIIINTVVPLLFAYGKIRHDDFFMDKGIALLHSLPAEDNKITRQWKKIGFTPQDAFASQACIELFNRFCQPRKCLSCEIGKFLMAGCHAQKSLPDP